MINHIKRVRSKRVGLVKYKKDSIYRVQEDGVIGIYYYNKSTNISYLICTIDDRVNMRFDRVIYIFCLFWQDISDTRKYRIDKMIEFDTLEASKRQALRVINDCVTNIKYRIDYGFLT